MVLAGVPNTGILDVHSNDLVWQFLELVLGSVVGKKLAVRAAIKWRYVQQGTLSAVNDRVFIEQGARHKPTSQRLVAGVFVAPAVYVVMAFRTCRDKFSEV
jgi:hypothetical protein